MEEFKASGSTRVVWASIFVDFRGSPGIDLELALNSQPAPMVAPPQWSLVDWRQAPSSADGFAVVIETASGWPYPSLAAFAGTRANEPGTVFAPRFALVLGQPEIEEGETARIVPLRPLWPGFAINTLFYAVILWLLFAAPFVLQRFCRVKRGLCARCAYPIGVNDVCTECGTRLRPGRGVGVL